MKPELSDVRPSFRFRRLLDPVYVYRRAREIRSYDDFAGRVANIAVYLYGRVEHAAYEWKGRWLPAYRLVVRRELLCLLNVWRDPILDFKLLVSRFAFSKRAKKRFGISMDLVPNPPSPRESGISCRYRMSWNIHIACNYDCSYCWFHGHWDEFKSKSRVLSVEEWARHWERFNAVHGPAEIDIAGGEPFTYPRFLEILAVLVKKNLVLISTNLSWGVERFIERIPSGRVEIAASFHPEFAGSAEDFLDKVIRLRRAGFRVIVTFVAHPPLLHRMLGFADLFLSRGIHFEAQPFRGVWRGREYPENYTRAARRFLEGLINEKHKRKFYPHIEWSSGRHRREEIYPLILEYQLGKKPTYGIPCNAGVFYARLHADGEVYRCAQGAYVGNFFNEDFRLWDAAAACPFRSCECINEIEFIQGAPRGPQKLQKTITNSRS